MLEFYKGKNVFITGHTGFKGAWLSYILTIAGANVTGYALQPQDEVNLFSLLKLDEQMQHIVGDIRDYDKLDSAIQIAKPEIVFHLAAQPLVLESYNNPRYTYEVNVIGTVNLLESLRTCSSVKSVLNVTTDKVYKNDENDIPFSEDMHLDGFDPYSNSKSCSELVTHSYKSSFFNKIDSPVISTARAGNVIGGGDFAANRIVPDCVRAAIAKAPIVIRNPNSTRPYQHVLEPLFAYLMIAEQQVKNKELSGWYNVGPNESDCVTTGVLVDKFCTLWQGTTWIDQSKKDAPHEANFLKLDCTKLKSSFNWQPSWNIDTALEKTVEWSKCFAKNNDMRDITTSQINEFININNK